MKQNKHQIVSGFHVLVWKEDKWFVAKSIEVEVASQGKTQKEALSNLKEALFLYFENEKVSLPPLLGNPELHYLPFSNESSPVYA